MTPNPAFERDASPTSWLAPRNSAIIAEMFSYANRFVFSSVACYPAKTTLPNGENAHCTVRPLAWRRLVFAAAAARYPGVTWTLLVAQHEHNDHGVLTITAGG